MLIVTNSPRFPASFRGGESVSAGSADEFLAHAHRPDALFLVNCDPALVLRLSMSLWTRKHPPLVALDTVLRRPRNVKTRIALPLRRTLLRRVDRFIHYFRDTRGLSEVWGIGPERSSFVPFKVNLPVMREPVHPGEGGEYVLCFGRSMRDFDTFFAAMEQLPYPGAIAEPNVAELQAHGARFSRPISALPKNIRILPDDNSSEAQIRILRETRILVIPVLKTSLVASGISTCLNAMALGRCIVGSEGPGMSDVFDNGEVLTAPPEDANALAAVIRQAWEDDALRRRTAEAGYRYALAAGGERELYERVIADIVSWRASISR